MPDRLHSAVIYHSIPPPRPESGRYVANKCLFMLNKSAEKPEAARTSVRKVRIDPELAGQRIDNFLRREMPGLPKSRLYRILRRGEVRVNGGRVKAEYRSAGRGRGQDPARATEARGRSAAGAAGQRPRPAGHF